MATMEYPRLCQREKAFNVEFAPKSAGARCLPLRMVLDFGSSGEVLGFEVINLMLKVGKHALEVLDHTVPTTGDGVSYGYDDESDSFYFHLMQGRSVVQRSMDGIVICDKDGRMIGLSVEWKDCQ